jgi:hypothetical protein
MESIQKQTETSINNHNIHDEKSNLNEKLITSKEDNKDNNNCCQCLCFPGVDLSHCLGICCFILFY